MPFPETEERTTESASLIIGGCSATPTWRGFGSTIFSFLEPELFERPGRPHAKPPIPVEVQDGLIDIAYGDCGLTRGRVMPFRYEREYYREHAYSPAWDWSPGDLAARGIDRVLDHIQKAKARGLSEIVGTCGTWDLHKSLLAENGRTLRANAYGEYVSRVVRTLVHWKKEYGVELKAWSLFNEPNYPRSKPTALDPAGHIELTRLLGRALEDAGLATRIMVADDWTISHAALHTAKAVLETPEARKFCCAVAYHSYDGYDFLDQDPEAFENERLARTQLAELCAHHGIETWMTEVSNFRPSESAWHNASFRMGQIFDDLEYGNVTAWDFMLDVWCGGWRKNARGGPQALAEFYYEPDGTIRRTQMTWTGMVIGHFAQAIRPGWIRTEVKFQKGCPKLRAVAFLDSDKEASAIVLLADGNAPVELSVTLPSDRRWLPTDRTFYSNGIDTWADYGPLTWKTGNDFNIELKPRSATTIMLRSTGD